MADTARARKLADRVHVIVAECLEKRIKDPRLGFVTVTDARVTGDLQHATVFYTVFGDPEQAASSAAALESAKGVIRSEVGKRTGIRLTPTLEFIADAIPQNASQLDDLLAIAAAKDAQVAALAARATYAGDPDPYRRPAEELDAEDDDAEGDDAESHESEGHESEDDGAGDGAGVRAFSPRAATSGPEDDDSENSDLGNSDLRNSDLENSELGDGS